MVCWWYVKTLEEHSPFSLANSEWHVICPVHGVHSGWHCLRRTGQPYPRQDLLYNIVHVRLLYESTVSHRRQVINSQSQTFDVTIYGNCSNIMIMFTNIQFQYIEGCSLPVRRCFISPIVSDHRIIFFSFSNGPRVSYNSIDLVAFLCISIILSVRHF